MLALTEQPYAASSRPTQAALAKQAVSSGHAQGTTFVPTYDWAMVPEGARVPPGLEVRMSVDGTGTKMARISPSWRMLVVSEPGNDACRLDVTRNTTLAQIRAAVAEKLAGGEVPRVSALLADGVALTSDDNWARTVGDAQLFGRRMTCTIAEESAQKKGAEASAELRRFEDLIAEFRQIEAAVATVERDLKNSTCSASAAHSSLAQLEARLERLQCKGIDSVVASSEAAKAQRRDLTWRVELLSAHLNGIFVGLNASKAVKPPEPSRTPPTASDPTKMPAAAPAPEQGFLSGLWPGSWK